MEGDEDFRRSRDIGIRDYDCPPRKRGLPLPNLRNGHSICPHCQRSDRRNVTSEVSCDDNRCAQDSTIPKVDITTRKESDARTANVSAVIDDERAAGLGGSAGED